MSKSAAVTVCVAVPWSVKVPPGKTPSLEYMFTIIIGSGAPGIPPVPPVLIEMVTSVTTKSSVIPKSSSRSPRLNKNKSD